MYPASLANWLDKMHLSKIFQTEWRALSLLTEEPANHYLIILDWEEYALRRNHFNQTDCFVWIIHSMEIIIDLLDCDLSNYIYQGWHWIQKFMKCFNEWKTFTVRKWSDLFSRRDLEHKIDDQNLNSMTWRFNLYISLPSIIIQ